MFTKNKINLHLIGKKYLDNLFFIDKLELSETNEIKNSLENLGGIYNIQNIDGLNPTYFPIGEKRAIIISEHLNSRRTSIVEDSKPVMADELIKIYNRTETDWTHIAYIDDIEIPHLIESQSVDFCTTKDRNNFKSNLDNCVIAFDSRERKGLYKELNLTSAVLVLHDQNGCEAIFKNKTIHSHHIKEIKGMNVNGAGDLFAGIFIREFMKSNLYNAVQSTCEITTNILKQRQENEKI
tara:strand:- start:13 stop:726 length:714 start_codon:yes stop_codon:yes gene_type:complete